MQEAKEEAMALAAKRDEECEDLRAQMSRLEQALHPALPLGTIVVGHIVWSGGVGLAPIAS